MRVTGSLEVTEGHCFMDRFEEVAVLSASPKGDTEFTSTMRKPKRASASDSELRRFKLFGAPVIHCFACYRRERHCFGGSGSLLLAVLSCGLYFVFGRYRCKCCGNPRWVRYDWLNLRYLFNREK